MSIITRHIINLERIMKASIVDLRYKTSEILQALDRNENITILYHGKIKAVIQPVKIGVTKKVKEHPFFGLYRENQVTVLEELENLRKPRYDI